MLRPRASTAAAALLPASSRPLWPLSLHRREFARAEGAARDATQLVFGRERAFLCFPPHRAGSGAAPQVRRAGFAARCVTQQKTAGCIFFFPLSVIAGMRKAGCGSDIQEMRNVCVPPCLVSGQGVQATVREAGKTGAACNACKPCVGQAWAAVGS